MTSPASVCVKENEAPWPCGGKWRFWNHLFVSGHYRNEVKSVTGGTSLVDMCDGHRYMRHIEGFSKIPPGSCVLMQSSSYPWAFEEESYKKIYPGAFE